MELTLNGRQVVADPAEEQSLIELLRDDLGLRSLKDGCAPEGSCDACTVIVDERAVTSCTLPIGSLEGADVVMMLRLQRERMAAGLVPSSREFFRFYGLDAEKLARAKPDAIVMHPGPMNRGIEIDSAIADDPERSVIGEQVEMGVAVRMAVLDVLARDLRRNA